ncbi:hypothetical protein AMECASPLE_035093, partial [Ameca splendens]
HEAGELGGNKQAHLSLLPLPVGHSRVEESPTSPGAGFQSPHCEWRRRVANRCRRANGAECRRCSRRSEADEKDVVLHQGVLTSFRCCVCNAVFMSSMENRPVFHSLSVTMMCLDFNLKTSDSPDTDFPVRILNLRQGALWYKKDNKFKIPKGGSSSSSSHLKCVSAYIRFHLISPIIQETPDNLVLFDLFINILAHNLAELAYEADVAQLEYKLMAGEHGLVIRLKGFNHKLPLLLKLIVDQLMDFSTEPSVFNMFMEQLKKTYFNILIKHNRLGRDVRLLILEPHRWSVIQKYRALTEGLSIQQLTAFVAALKSELYAEGLVQGNFTSAESREFLQYFT